MQLYIRLGLIAGVLLLLWYTFNQGVEAGVNKTVAAYADAQDEAVAQYQADVQAVVDSHNTKLLAIRREYEAELAKQTEQAANLARQEAVAGAATVQIREKIRYVESSHIGADAFSVYQQTRRIISDPRNSEAGTYSPGKAPN